MQLVSPSLSSLAWRAAPHLRSRRRPSPCLPFSLEESPTSQWVLCPWGSPSSIPASQQPPPPWAPPCPVSQWTSSPCQWVLVADGWVGFCTQLRQLQLYPTKMCQMLLTLKVFFAQTWSLGTGKRDGSLMMKMSSPKPALPSSCFLHVRQRNTWDFQIVTFSIAILCKRTCKASFSSFVSSNAAGGRPCPSIWKTTVETCLELRSLFLLKFVANDQILKTWQTKAFCSLHSMHLGHLNPAHLHKQL